MSKPNEFRCMICNLLTDDKKLKWARYDGRSKSPNSGVCDHCFKLMKSKNIKTVLAYSKRYGALSL